MPLRDQRYWSLGLSSRPMDRLPTAKPHTKAQLERRLRQFRAPFLHSGGGPGLYLPHGGPPPANWKTYVSDLR